MTTFPPTAPARIRVMLVDDHPLFRTALRHVLETCAEIDIVAEAADGAEALRLVEQLAPDIVCMDRRLPVLSGLEATRRLRLSHPGVKVIGLSACDERATEAEILESGARAYVSKLDAGGALVRVIRACHGAG